MTEGSRYEISVDGIVRTHRDSLEIATVLKACKPYTNVVVRDLLTGKVIQSAASSQLGITSTALMGPAQGLEPFAQASAAAFVEPSIPTIADRPPAGPAWLHEIKHDGYRFMVWRDGERVRLFTR